MGLLLCSTSFAENLPKQLFGVTLYENIEKYADKETGLKEKERKNIITFTDENLTGLDKNSDFNKYNIRTDENYNILLIGGRNNYAEQDPTTFKNFCSEDKVKLVKTLSAVYDVNSSEFDNNFYIQEHLEQKVLIQTSEIQYYKKFNNIPKALRLNIYCVYANLDDGSIWSRLDVVLMDDKYYKEKTLKLWHPTQPFDDEDITTDLKGF